jgi:aerobic-type carbon monoxide dehydrogenase small subunit (CoxS/CutS family)
VHRQLGPFDHGRGHPEQVRAGKIPKALLDRNPNPTETETRYWLAGNLCRCTGYDKVIRAVLDAAAELRGE